MDLATLHIRIDSESARGELEKLRRKTKQVQNEARGRGKRTGAPATQKAAKGMQKQADSATKLRRELSRVNQLDLANLSPSQFKKTGSAIESLSTSMNRMYRQGKISLEQYNKLDAELGNLRTKYNKYTSSVNKNNESKKKHLSILDDLWRSFDRGTGMILRQVQLWGLLSAVLVGAQAAYAGIAVVATRAGSTLRENAHQLNMSVQALQKLQFAATSVGMSVRDLRDGLGELSTSIVDAVKGQASAKEAFEDLGISLSTLINEGNNTNAMFDKVMAKLSETDSAAKRLSIAQDVFGETAGRQALKFIGRMEQAREVVDQFHGALSDRLAKSAAETWNRFRLLWTVLKGQFIQAAAEATGIINKFADQLLKAAKQGNLFKQTLVPAIENTAAVIKALIPIVQNLYRFINFLAQNFWYVEQAGKALIGLGLVKVLNRLTGAISAASSATGVLNRAWVALGATIKSVLRFTGYYLLFEGILRVIEAVRHLNKIVSTSELTFEMAARAAMENFINNTIDGLETFWDYIQSAMEKIVNYIPDMMGKAGTNAWEALKKGFQGEGEAPTGSSWITPGLTSALKGASRFVSSALGNRADRLDYTEEEEQFSNWMRSRFRQAGGGQQGGGSDLFKDGGVDLTPEGKMEEYKKALKEISESFDEDIDLNIPELRDMESLPDKLDTSTLLRHFEDINSEFGSFYDKFKTAAEEGRGSKVRELIPLASKEVQVNVDKTREKLERTREVLDTLKSMPPGVGPSPDELREAELKVTKMEKQYESLIDKQKELRTTQMALGRGIGPSGKSQIEEAGEEAGDVFTAAFNISLQTNAKSFQDALDNVFQSISSSVGSAAGKRIGNQLSKELGSGFGAQLIAGAGGGVAGSLIGSGISVAYNQLGDMFEERTYKANVRAASTTGTVLGDDSAMSKSLDESVSILDDFKNENTQLLNSINSNLHRAGVGVERTAAGLARDYPQFGGLGSGAAGRGAAFNIGEEIGKGLTAWAAPFEWLGLDFGEKIRDWTGGAFGEVGSAMFGGDKKVKQRGIQIGRNRPSIEELTEGGGVGARAFAKIREEGGWFSSGSTSWKVRSLNNDVTNALDSVFQNVASTVQKLGRGLGADMEEVLSYTFDPQRLNLKGLSAQKRQKKIQNYISTQMDVAASELFGDVISQYQKVDEGLFETANRVLSVKNVLLDLFERTQNELDATAERAVHITQQVKNAFGGLDKAQQAVSRFYQNFIPEEEQQQYVRSQIQEVFDSLNRQIPETRKGFQSLIESLDLTTSSGRNAYSTLINFSGQMDKHYSYMNDTIREMRNQVAVATGAKTQAEVKLGSEYGPMFQDLRGSIDSRASLRSATEEMTDLFKDYEINQDQFTWSIEKLIEEFREWKEEMKQSQDQVVVVKVGEEDFKTYIQEEADAVRVEAERRQVGDTPIFG